MSGRRAGLVGRLLGRVSVRTKLASVVAVFLAVIAIVLILSASSGSADETRALVDNIAGRQATLVERYSAEVILKSEGFRADPGDTADELTKTAEALVNGGDTMAVQSNSNEITIPATSDPVVRVKLLDAQQRIAAFVALGNQILNTAPTDPAYRGLVDRFEAASHVVANVSYDAVGRATTDAAETVRANTLRGLIFAIAGSLLAVLFSLLIIRGIVRPLRSVLTVYARMADGDLSVSVPPTGTDEVGRIGAGLNQVLVKLRGAMATLSGSATKLTTAGVDLAQVSGDLEASSTANLAGAERVSGATGSINDAVADLVSNVEELRAQTGQIADHAREASTVAGQAEEAGAAITDAVEQLGAASTRIGLIVKTISAVAEQTNLLALNATIEAARAGDAGKGFGVVAGEVKDLARQAAEATADIDRMVKDVQSRVAESSRTSATIAPIIAKVRERQAEITHAVESQVATATAMVGKIDRLAATSTEISTDIADVTRNAAETKTRARQTNQATTQLTAMAETLSGVVQDWTA